MLNYNFFKITLIPPLRFPSENFEQFLENTCLLIMGLHIADKIQLSHYDNLKIIQTGTIIVACLAHVNSLSLL